MQVTEDVKLPNRKRLAKRFHKLTTLTDLMRKFRGQIKNALSS